MAETHQVRQVHVVGRDDVAVTAVRVEVIPGAQQTRPGHQVLGQAEFVPPDPGQRVGQRLVLPNPPTRGEPPVPGR